MGTHLLTLFSAFFPFQPWGPRELQSGSIYCRTDKLTLVHPMTSGESLGKDHKAHEPPAIVGVLASTAPHGCHFPCSHCSCLPWDHGSCSSS